MLNETYLLWQALDRARLTIPREHPRVKPPGSSTGPCLRVRLDEQGHVAAVETVTKDEWPGLWTVMEGNHNSFPVVRVKEPLCDVPRSSDIWKKLGFDEQGKRRKSSDNKARLSILTDALRDGKQLSGKRNQQLWLRLRNKAKELLQHADDNHPEGAILQEFAQSFQKAASDPNILLRAIAERALQDVQHARLDDLDTVETLLVGKGPPNDRDRQPQMTVQLAFDLHDDHSFPQRLYSQKVRDYVKRILPLEQEESPRGRNSKSNHPARVCAFTGEEQPLQVTPFPKVRLPVLNKDFPLVSMFSDAECNKRYGLTDALIVPVAKKRHYGCRMHSLGSLRKNVKGRRGGVSPVESSKQPRDVRGSALTSLSCTLTASQRSTRISLIFSALMKEYSRSNLRLMPKLFAKHWMESCEERPGSKLNLFLLRKASEGQAHVAVAESPSVEDVLSAAQWWQQAAANVPEVTLPLPGKKGEHAVRGEPHAPYPDQVVRLFQYQWVVTDLPEAS